MSATLSGSRHTQARSTSAASRSHSAFCGVSCRSSSWRRTRPGCEGASVDVRRSDGDGSRSTIPDRGGASAVGISVFRGDLSMAGLKNDAVPVVIPRMGYAHAWR